MLLYVLAANCSHPQEATSVEDKYSLVIKFSNISGNICVHISDIPLIYITIKIELKL
jgi:hypothetical protein